MTPRSVPHEFVQLQTTLDDRKDAEALIREVVERRLAACGQLVGPIESTYWWKGSIEEAQEWLCVFKTRAELASDLEDLILERHTYDVPEIVALPIVGLSEAYGEWIENETEE